jgi:hypothetical protein
MQLLCVLLLLLLQSLLLLTVLTLFLSRRGKLHAGEFQKFPDSALTRAGRKKYSPYAIVVEISPSTLA